MIRSNMRDYQKAIELQEAVESSERYSRELSEKFGLGGLEFTKEHINQSIVNMRQDIVLIYSHINSLNEKVNTIKLLGFAILAVLLVIAYALVFITKFSS